MTYSQISGCEQITSLKKLKKNDSDFSHSHSHKVKQSSYRLHTGIKAKQLEAGLYASGFANSSDVTRKGSDL